MWRYGAVFLEPCSFGLGASTIKVSAVTLKINFKALPVRMEHLIRE